MRRLVILILMVVPLAVIGCRRDGKDGTVPAVPATASAAEDVVAPAAGDVPPAFTNMMNAARERRWSELEIGDIVARVGQHFSGAPYEAGLLDRGEAETLVVALDSFDCVLLVETALAAARSIREQNYTFESFRQNLALARYRGGEMDGYCSRLHYFTDWIRDNERKGIVRDVTADIGGIRLEKNLDFMSAHRESYPRFATNDSLFAGIRKMEGDLAQLEIFYIPQDRISAAYDRIQAGDIIATATNIEGLDVSHTGIAYRDGDRVGFLHASTSGGVKVSPDLQVYVQNNKIQIGIVVARPL